MSERWRKPVEIAAIEHDPGNILYIGDRPMLDADVTVSTETLERMRQGYICAQCFEPHEEALPEACIVCGFPMRAMQAERIATEYGGEKWIGPRTSNADEFERMAEENERRKKSRIVLPPGTNVT
jgi:hypothetical protein